MFDKLIEIVLQFIDLFRFWEIIDDYERGIVLRLGKYSKSLDPGLHFITPLGVDKVLKDNVVPRTANLGAQALVTLDGKQITVSAIVTAQIRDIRKIFLEVENVDQALTDSCYATIGDLVVTHTWDQLRTPEFSDTLTKACRKQAFRYGIEILRVQLADLMPSRGIRLFQV